MCRQMTKVVWRRFHWPMHIGLFACLAWIFSACRQEAIQIKESHPQDAQNDAFVLPH
jgi:hypothetical protein